MPLLFGPFVYIPCASIASVQRRSVAMVTTSPAATAAVTALMFVFTRAVWLVVVFATFLLSVVVYVCRCSIWIF